MRSGSTAIVHRLAFRDGRLAESRTHVFQSELPDEELEAVLDEAQTAQDAVDALVEGALLVGAHDNVTAIVVRVLGDADDDATDDAADDAAATS